MKRPLAAAAASLVLLAACGDDGGSDRAAPADRSSSSTAAAPADAPQRIVSLSPSATEMLFAIGAGEQVVAVDSNSSYPAEAPVTDLSAYEPNVEAITTYDPDLVVVDGTDPDLTAGLDKVGIEVLEAPAAQDLDDVYAQLVDIGEATGHADRASEVADQMRADVEAIVAKAPRLDSPLRIYHELDDTLYSVTSGTFLGELYSLVGLENVADAADAQGQSGGYPQLSPEYLIDADPDIVFLADSKCCAQTPETFAARPGFAALTAVTEGAVVTLDDDVASRWGPRVVDLLREIVDAVEDVAGEDRAAA